MTATRTLRIGTRASALARTQTGFVADAIVSITDAPVEIVPIVTEGDRTTAALTQIGGTGVFVSALRTALLDGRIDVAVHSFKDLPTLPADGVQVAAVPVREDPRDALIARDGLTLGELPPGARIGTGSPRRAAQIRALGLGVEIVPLRGNVDTRIGKVRSGELDAVVLAYAGLRRLGRADEVSEVLDPIQVLPAPAQGALAVEVRTGDESAAAALAPLDHADTRVSVEAERALLIALEAGCLAPIGGLAETVDADPAEGDGAGDPAASRAGIDLFLRGSVTALDGSDAVRLSVTGPASNAADVGRRLAALLVDSGAETLMGTSLGSSR